jgi:hypothetical protein
MSQKDPLGRDSYNELRNEWVETRNVMLRMQGGILHPPAYLSPVARLLGYLWRIMVVVLVVGLAYVFLLKHHLGSTEFSEMMAEKTVTLMGAEKGELEEFRWKGKTGVSKSGTMSGGKGFFEELSAESIRVKVTLGTLLDSAWDLGDIFIGDLDITLKSGGAGGSDVASTGDESATKLLFGGWGVNPDFSQLTFNKIDVASANFKWGLSEFTRGSLTDAAIEFKKADGIWQVLVSSGKLSQNYLKDLDVSSLKASFLKAGVHVDVEKDEVVFSEGTFTLGESGTGTIGGSVTTGEFPEFNIDVTLSNFELADLLSEDVNKILSGRADGEIHIMGSTNRRAGLRTTGNLKFDADTEKTFKFLSVQLLSDLGAALSDIYIQQAKVTSGTIEFSTSEGMFTASNIDLRLGQFSQISGGFTYGIPKGEDGDVRIPKPLPVDLNKPELRQIVEGPEPELSGEIQFGIESERVDKLPQSVIAQFFPTERDGKLWMTIPLSGSVNRVTADQARDLMKAVNAKQ